MELIKKIRVELARTVAGIKGEKFTATMDGSIVEPEGGELKTGVKLNVKLPDGTMQPAPAGEVTLEDGTIVVVGNDGMITEVRPKEETPADQDMSKPPAAPTPPKSVEQTTSTITMFTEEAKAEMKTMFAAVIAEEVEKRLAGTVKAETFSTVETGLNDFKTEISRQLTALSDLVETIAAEPSAQSFKDKSKKVGDKKTDSAEPKSDLQLRIEKRKATQN